ncbi:toxin-antitoxin system YwqK family antitoxin [Aestuariivivens sediminis]|uniref:toxin-antitoxin system YwqK family antitoxin n=1 Tax=Aestuariivivens sediminis TaxID=2913557 RepID=UPI001F5642B0|nr:toxin-antitoxin system YwqK family antitoxin [Aestuariivivens sediminis]
MTYQNIIIIFTLLNVGMSWAQSINQFDADGERHGRWLKRYDGTKVLRYEGEFFHGKEIGTFKFYKNDEGKPLLAATKTFNDSDNKASVQFFNDHGKLLSEGIMKGKAYIGTWTYYQNNGQDLLTVEHYDHNGKLNGERLVYYDNGEVAEIQHYNGGLLDGKSKWFSEDQIVLKEYIYVNGELHGPAKYFDPKGALIAEGEYKKGKKTGIWKFYEKGKLVEEKDFNYKPKYIKVDGKYKKAPH